MENTESKIKNFEKLSRMLVIKPANELFSQFSNMFIDNINVNHIKYDEDSEMYFINVSINISNPLDSKSKMSSIIYELSHMLLNTSEYIFIEMYILELKFKFESYSLPTSFDLYGNRQSDRESLVEIKKLLEDNT